MASVTPMRFCRAVWAFFALLTCSAVDSFTSPSSSSFHADEKLSVRRLASGRHVFLEWMWLQKESLMEGEVAPLAFELDAAEGHWDPATFAELATVSQGPASQENGQSAALAQQGFSLSLLLPLATNSSVDAASLRKIAPRLPRIARRVSGSFLGTAGLAALSTVMKSSGMEEDIAEGIAILVGASIREPVFESSSARSIFASSSSRERDDAKGDNEPAGSFLAQAESAEASSVSVLADLASRLQETIATGKAQQSTYFSSASLGFAPCWYGTTIQPVLDDKKTGTLVALRVGLSFPPSTHSSTRLLSHSTVSTLLTGGGATPGTGVASLWKQLQADDAEADGVGSFSAAGGGNNGLACAGLSGLPFALDEERSTGSGNFSCPLTAAILLGFYDKESQANAEGNAVDAASSNRKAVISATPTAPPPNEGWDRDPLQTIGRGLGISSTFLPGFIAPRSRWHSVSVKRFVEPSGRALSRVMIRSIVEVPRSTLLRIAAASKSQGLAADQLPLPLAVVLGLTHEDDAKGCGCFSRDREGSSPHQGQGDAPNGGGIVVLRSCPLLDSTARGKEIRMWQCTASSDNNGVCGWSVYPLSSLPALSLLSPPPPSHPSPASPGSSSPSLPLTIDRRLSAPMRDGGGLGRGTVLETASLQLAAALGSKLTAEVRHSLPWFAAPTVEEASARTARIVLEFRNSCKGRHAVAESLFVDLSAPAGIGTGRRYCVVGASPSAARSAVDVEVEVSIEHSFSLLPSSAAFVAHQRGKRGPPVTVLSRWNVSATGAGLSASPISSLVVPGGLELRFAAAFGIASPVLMHAEELPPDTHRGLELPGATVEIKQQHQSPKPRLQWRYPLGTLLFEPPSPDFAMPYNVMVLAGTAIAFVLGQMTNILARADEMATAAATGSKKQRLLARLRGKCRREKTA